MAKVKTAALANVLRYTAKLVKEQQEKLAAFEQRERVDRVIAKMAEKGMHPDLTDDDLREDLLKKAAAGRLDAVEEAVEYSGGMNVVKIASDDSGSVVSSDISGAELESFVLTGE
jgi:hypothetical protein